MQKTLKYTIFKTKWGYFGLAGTEYGLLRTHLPGPKPEKIKSHLLNNSALVNRASSIEFAQTFFKATQEQITSYFEGACVNFSDVPIILDGFSFFVSSVLTACRNIGFGRTISYSGLAKKLGPPCFLAKARTGAARAVGNALAKNPLPLIIPCHRVVRSDGKIGGFSAPGGVKLKKRLLQFEQEVLQRPKT